jgi:hypothetical protein
MVFVISTTSLLYAQNEVGRKIIPIIAALLLDEDGQTAATTPPGVPILVAATSADSDALTVEWIPASDNLTPADQMKYDIHLSTTEGFKPTPGTRKKTVTGIDYDTVTGLLAQTKYYIMIVAINGDGNTSWSNQLAATTAASAAVRTAIAAHVQDAANAPRVTETTITYTPTDDTVPEIGDIIISTEGDGYHRKAVNVSRQDGNIVVETEAASLSQTYENLEFTTLVRMEDPQPTAETETLSATSQDAQERVRTWPSGLTLSRKRAQTTEMHLSATETFAAAEAATGTISHDGKYVDLSVQKYSSASPGTTMHTPLTFSNYQQIEVCMERNWMGFCTQKETFDTTLCDVQVTDVDHPDADKETLNPLPAVTNNEIRWTPEEGHVDEKLRPYEVEVTAWVGADTAGGCDQPVETIEVRGIKINVGQGEFNFSTENKAESFTGTDFDLTNEVTVDFEPELDVAARIASAQLMDARIIARGNLQMTQVMQAVATAAATITGEATVFTGSFIKIFTVPPGIPIMVRGELALKLKASATAQGELDFTETFQNTFEVAFGVEYDRTNGWSSVREAKNSYDINIGGEARGGLNARFDLIPDVKLHFYEVISGHMILSPYVYADAGIEGHFQYLNADGSQKTDLDYALTQFEAGAGVDLYLFAGLHALDMTVFGYPPGGQYDNPDTYEPFIPVDQTRFLGIPDLSAQANDTVWGDHDSRTVLISGQATEVENPLYSLWGFGDQHIIKFDQWTGANLVETASTCQAEIHPADNLGEYWLLPLTPGTCTVRLASHSTLGWFARQAVETSFDASDRDDDGMADYWEARFSLDDPNGDDDADGIINLDEYKNGTFPSVPDSADDSDDDGMPDWWEELYGLDPFSSADAAQDSDGDGYSNLREYQGGTDPLDPRDHPDDQSSLPFPDTGQTLCYDNSAEITCPSPGQAFYGQDAQYQGPMRSYTKLDASGNDLPNTASDWVMVRDNVTGLIWEVKTDDDSFHDRDNTYTWCDTNPDTNGGDQGTCGAATDTEDFINALNSAGFGGYSDWRMPTLKELVTLLDYSTLNPSIDTAIFPNTVSFEYWSSTTDAGDTNDAWRLYFYNGNDNVVPKSTNHYVRAVRGGQ